MYHSGGRQLPMYSCARNLIAEVLRNDDLEGHPVENDAIQSFAVDFSNVINVSLFCIVSDII